MTDWGPTSYDIACDISDNTNDKSGNKTGRDSGNETGGDTCNVAGSASGGDAGSGVNCGTGGGIEDNTGRDRFYDNSSTFTIVTLLTKQQMILPKLLTRSLAITLTTALAVPLQEKEARGLLPSLMMRLYSCRHTNINAPT